MVVFGDINTWAGRDGPITVHDGPDQVGCIHINFICASEENLTLWFATRPDINLPVQKRARSLKFLIYCTADLHLHRQKSCFLMMQHSELGVSLSIHDR